jgi:hypothetical protein
MSYEAHVEKVINLIDNGDLEWELALVVVLDYISKKLIERVEMKKYLDYTS